MIKLQNTSKNIACHIKDHSDFIHIEWPNVELRTFSRDFVEWFRGFSDAEAFFTIKQNVSSSFSYIFGIGLQIDDLDVLNHIKDTLGIGKVRVDQKLSIAHFKVTSLSEIALILAIFNKFNLNSTKDLNFLAFQEAFKLSMDNNNKEGWRIINPLIHNIKNKANNLRSDFTMPDNHKIVITREWLLGFSESDGSFSYIISGESLSYSISQKDKKALLIAIKDYLLSINPQLGIYGVKEAPKIYPLSIDRIFQLAVRDLNYLESVIISLFNDLTWYTKKELDFKDWKLIIKLRKQGYHLSKEGVDLIARIAGQMNNRRLSTYNALQENRSLLMAEVNKLLEKGSNYIVKGNKVWIKSLNRFKNDNYIKVVHLIEKCSGDILMSFESQSYCARFFNMGEAGIRKRIKNKTIFSYEGKKVYVMR